MKVDVPTGATPETEWQVTRLSPQRYYQPVPSERASWDQPGRMLYEIEGLDEKTARQAFRLAAAKLSVQTTFVTRTVL